LISDPLAEMVISQDLKQGATVKVEVRKNNLHLDIQLKKSKVAVPA
jgi:hypothetical protein